MPMVVRIAQSLRVVAMISVMEAMMPPSAFSFSLTVDLARPDVSAIFACVGQSPVSLKAVM